MKSSRKPSFSKRLAKLQIDIRVVVVVIEVVAARFVPGEGQARGDAPEVEVAIPEAEGGAVFVVFAFNAEEIFAVVCAVGDVAAQAGGHPPTPFLSPAGAEAVAFEGVRAVQRLAAHRVRARKPVLARVRRKEEVEAAVVLVAVEPFAAVVVFVHALYRAADAPARGNPVGDVAVHAEVGGIAFTGVDAALDERGEADVPARVLPANARTGAQAEVVVFVRVPEPVGDDARFYLAVKAVFDGDAAFGGDVEMHAVRVFRRGEGPFAVADLSLALARRVVDVAVVAVVAAGVECPAAAFAQGFQRLVDDVADVFGQVVRAQFFKLAACRFVLVVGEQGHCQMQAHRLQAGVFGDHFTQAGDGEAEVAVGARFHRFAKAQQHFVLFVGGQFFVDGQQHGDGIGVAVDDGAVQGVGEQRRVSEQFGFGDVHDLRLLFLCLVFVFDRVFGAVGQARVRGGGFAYRRGRDVLCEGDAVEKGEGNQGNQSHCSVLFAGKIGAQVYTSRLYFKRIVKKPPFGGGFCSMFAMI